MQATFIRREPGEAHATIDIDALRREVDAGTDDRHLISGPYDLAVYLNFVELFAASASAVEADLFVWARGPGSDLATTRLGGIPYLPADAPWPTHMDCAGSFIGQLDFRDSRDLVGDTPGDVLMVFQFLDLYDILDSDRWETECFRGIWTQVDDRPRVAQGQERAPPFSESILHGFRCRTWDRLEIPDEDGDTLSIVAPATKIGGHPYDAQCADAEIPAGSRFLGQLAAVWPRCDAPYPSVDRPEPLPSWREVSDEPEVRARWKRERAELKSWGEGFLPIYLDDAGTLSFGHSFT